jgi:hypothetical protein
MNTKTNTPWITIGIKTSCVQKRKLYTASRNSTNPHIKRYYKHYCNILSKVIKEAKKHHYDNQIKNSTSKNKTTWNIVNKETYRKVNSTNIKSLNIDGITTDNQQLIAETFNDYFVSTAENIKTKDRNAYMQNKNTPYNTKIDTISQYIKEVKTLRYTTFQSKPTTTTETENITKTLKPKNSYGYDEISTILLKITAPFISSPLNYTCNKVITKGIFPDRLKFSIIIKPLYKKVIKKK